MGEVGVRAGLAETCALGTSQPLRGARSSLVAQANLSMVVEPSSSWSPAKFRVSVRCVLCSLGCWGFL